ncbi:hypothetical protein [Bacillus cereus]|uniref:hypothetical protein n=1 Tax=Bacillus cereus TaxID=1396 RepID=UPI000BF281C3|nr:hypothetical protein [Bacillus cereus]PEU03191.1 hypothetical protein CN534_05070 [Bacillus cereus]PEZ62093.1 hypothetical protein CN370_09425 [Bacillus cereus]PFB67161.1 hypothetical protein CN292_21255 [Bacillus cereus]
MKLKGFFGGLLGAIVGGSTIYFTTRYDIKAEVEVKMLFSGLIGTVIGGCISFLTARYSLKKQFKEQERNRNMLNQKEQIIALKSVLNEIKFNNGHFKNFLLIIEDKKWDKLEIEGKDTMLNRSLKFNKWEKHSDTLESLEEIDYMDKLHSFYLQLTYDINSYILLKERVEFFIELTDELVEKLTKTIESFK